MLIEGKTPWEFACDWYKVEDIHYECSKREMPSDVRSREFAEWMTDQYRLAMNRGITIAHEAAKAAGGET